MAEIRLQEYTVKIKELIRHDQHDEAIAHCQHILRHYPRHIETYYLLGEACLERRMVREAIEFFQRTLSADPENFFGRVGLGIVYDEQGALLEAIWQMERAFELMPGNNEVRRELQRLYAQRDGVEKTRLKLTRGALGRLYSRNGLYEQAIGEFHTILRQDPDLPDIQLALIEALWREGRRLEAVEVCLELLQALPNCLKANLILGAIWTQGGHEDAGLEKLEVARSLDPENLMAQELFGKDSPLPPEEVWLEELVPTPAEVGLVPLGADQERAVAPWEMGGAAPATEGEEGTGAEAGWESGEDIPDWLRDMGLVAGEEASEASPQEEAVVEPVAGAAMPAWLQELMGEEAEAAPAPGPTPPEEDRGSQPELPAWLEELESAVPGEPSSLPDIGLAAGTASWLAEPAAAEAEGAMVPDEEKEGELPEWLQELGVPKRGAPLAGEDLPGKEELEDLPDWLRELRAGQEDLVPPLAGAEEPEIMAGLEEERDVLAAEAQALAAAMPEAPAAEPIAEEVEEVPGWLRDLGMEAAAGGAVEEAELTVVEAQALEAEGALPAGEDVPDWLLALGVVETRTEAEDVLEEQQSLLQEPDEAGVEAPAPAAEEEAEAPEAEEIPDWLRALGAPEAEVRAPEPVAEEEIEAPMAEEIPDWLQALGAPAAEVRAPETEEAEVPLAEEVPDDWLQAPGEPEAELPVAEERGAPAPSAGEIPESLRALVEAGILAEEDLAEAMAQMSPEDLEAQQAEAVPDWLQDLLGEGEAPVPAPEPEEEVEAPVADEIPDWLQALEPERAPEVPVGEPEVEEPAPAVVEEAIEVPVAEEAPDWLGALGEWVADVPAPPREETVKVPVAEEVSDWLEALGEPGAEERTPVAEEAVEVPVAEEVSDWLEALGEPGAEEPVPATEEAVEAPVAEEAPDWLEALGEPEAEEPTPATEEAVKAPVAEEVPPPPVPVAEPVAAQAAAGAEVSTPAGQRFQELRDELQARPRNHALRLEVARLCAGQREWSSALGHYEKLIAARKFLPDVLQDLLRLAASAEDVNPARVYQMLGDVYMQEDQLDRALEMYRQSRQALLKR